MQITTHPETLIATLVGALAVADDIRRAEVDRLASASDVERATLDKELQLLIAKYGAESPQAQAATARLAWLDTERAGIKAEVVRRAIPVPETSANRFVVYGRVLDPAGEGIPRLTVA